MFWGEILKSDSVLTSLQLNELSNHLDQLFFFFFFCHQLILNGNWPHVFGPWSVSCPASLPDFHHQPHDVGHVLHVFSSNTGMLLNQPSVQFYSLQYTADKTFTQIFSQRNQVLNAYGIQRMAIKLQGIVVGQLVLFDETIGLLRPDSWVPALSNLRANTWVISPNFYSHGPYPQTQPHLVGVWCHPKNTRSMDGWQYISTTGTPNSECITYYSLLFIKERQGIQELRFLFFFFRFGPFIHTLRSLGYFSPSAYPETLSGSSPMCALQTLRGVLVVSCSKCFANRPWRTPKPTPLLG